MQSAKERVTDLVQALPEDTSFDDILRELAFERMIQRGLKDVEEGRVISHEEMLKRIQSWQR
ncbi:MAG: hypothetical protein HYV26_14245 [Candidatus Hydrogenedentes bacterium]|nr:hypothetical protein [Candidatus Hydrogenedentota bacterium]